MTGAAAPSLLGFWGSTTLGTLVALPLVALLALGPGLLPALALGRRLSASVAESLAIAFTVSYAIVGVSTYVTYWLGLPLTATAAVWALLAVVSGGAAWRWRGSGGFISSRLAWLLTVAPALLALLQGVWMGLTGDVFFHLAAPRSLLERNAPLVTDPLYGTSTQVLDPVSGIWHTALAVWSRVTGLDIVTLWAPLAVVCAGMLGVSFFWLCRVISRSEKAAAWAAAAFLFSLQLDFRGVAYPNQGSRVFIFVAMAALIILGQHASRPAWLTAVAAGVAAGLVHLATAEILYVFMAALLVALAVGIARARARGIGADWSAWKWVLGASLTTIALTAPSVWERARVAGSSVMLERTAYDIRTYHIKLPLDVLVPRVSWEFVPAGGRPLLAAVALATTLLALGLLAAMVVRAWRNPEPRVWGGLAAASLAFWLMQFPPVSWVGVTFAPYMLYRLASLTAYTRFLLAAHALGDEQLRASRWRWIGPTALATFVLIAVPPAVSTWTGLGEDLGRNKPSFVTSLRADIRYLWGAEAIEGVRELAGDGFPRVAGDTATGYYLAGLAPVSTVAVGATHSTWSIERTEGEDRRTAIDELLSPTTSPSARRDILERYDVDYVAVSTETANADAVRASLTAQPELFETVVDSPGLVVFAVK